jgi:hypothetical protein
MLTLGKNHLIFDGGGAQIRKKYRAFPRTDEKYRARQIFKTNILQKFGKKISCEVDEKLKIEHFQKGAFPHQKSNGPSLSILSHARRLWKMN